MSRNLVTVKTKHGFVRVPAEKAPKSKPEKKAEPEKAPDGDQG